MNKVQAGVEMAKQKHCIFRGISTFSTSPKLAQKSLNCLAQVSPHWGGTGPAGEEQQGKVHIGLQSWTTSVLSTTAHPAPVTEPWPGRVGAQ